MTTSRPPNIDPQQVLEHDPFVRGLARQLLRDAHAADDVAQQTWEAAFRQPRSPSSLRGWLGAVVRRLAGRRARTDRRELLRQQAAARPELVPSAATIAQREAVRAAVVRAVLALPMPYREVVLLRWFENLPPRAIARRLGVPVETVRTRQKRALAELRQRLDDHAGGDRAAWCALLLPFAREAGLAAGAAAALGPLVTGVMLMSIPARLATVGSLLLGVLAAVWWLGPDAGAAPPLAATEPPGAPTPAGAEMPASADADAAADGTARAGERAAVVLPPMSSTGSLLVQAMWSDGSPASDLCIELRRPHQIDRLEILEATTDAAGEARFTGLAAGRIHVSAWRASWSESRAAEIVVGREVTALVKLTGGLDATGIVVDGAERPVADAEIVVADWGGGASRTLTRSRADGTFVLRAIGTHCHVGARAPGRCASRLCTITGSDGARVDGLRLVLDGPGAVVAGTVFAPDGHPVVGAVVRVGSLEQDSRKLSDGSSAMAPRPVMLRTDERGRFVVDSLPGGTLPIAVRVVGLARWQDVVDAQPGARRELTVHLQRGVTLSGVVRNDRNEPVAKADVRCADWQDLGHQGRTTGADGAFLFTDLPVGELPVHVNHDTVGKVETRVNGAPGQALTWNPVLSTGATLAGRVVDLEDHPIKDVLLEASSRNGNTTWRGSAMTDEAGAFRMDNCAAGGPITVAVRRHAMVEAHLRVAGFGEPLLIRLPKPEFVRVRGRVLGPDGKPLGNVMLSVRHESGGSDMDPVAADGSFDAGPYPPGELTVLMRSAGFAPIVRRRELAPNEVWDLAELRFERGGTMSLALFAPGSSPPKIQHVPVFHEDSQWIDHFECTDGVVRCGPLVPGEYTAQLRAEGLAVARVPFTIVAGADARIDVRMVPGVPVVLTCTVPAGAHPDSVSLEVLTADGALALRTVAHRRKAGLVAEAPLAAGNYRIVVTDKAWRGEGTVEVAGTGPAQCTLALTPR